MRRRQEDQRGATVEASSGWLKLEWTEMARVAFRSTIKLEFQGVVGTEVNNSFFKILKTEYITL